MAVLKKDIKVPRKILPKEWEEQAAFVRWLDMSPLAKGSYFSIPNEGERTYATVRRLKAQGMKPGVSDLFIFIPTRYHHGLFIEFKQAREYSPSERRKPSWIAQEMFQVNVRAAGYAAEFAFGCDHAIQILQRYAHSVRSEM